MNVVVGQRLYRVAVPEIHEGIVESVTKKRCVVRCWTRWFVNESSIGKDWFYSVDEARAETLRLIDEQIRSIGIKLARAHAMRKSAASGEVQQFESLPETVDLGAAQ